MNTITEKFTEKTNAFSISREYYVQKAEKNFKKQFKHFNGSITNELAPELLEAHIIALMGNALS